MPHRVCITGVGIITAIGNNAQENLQSLLQEKSGLRHTQYLNTVYKDIFPLGEIPYQTEKLNELANVAANLKLNRTVLLGIIAAQEAIAHARLEKQEIADLCFFNATTVSGMCDTENIYVENIDRQNTAALAADWFSLDGADCTQKMADQLGIKNYLSTISTACSSSANSIMLAARNIRAGKMTMALCGGTDALSKFTLNGFNSLKNTDKEPCRPFDANRLGLNLGEGAAYLILESEESAKKRNATILATISGWGNVSEAYHQTTPSPEGLGAYLSMKTAIDFASLAPTAIGYVNAHGTATYNNDLSEGIAIQKLFLDGVPFSSTKPYTGHTLAAAGAIEAVFSFLAIDSKSLFPNLNFKTQMGELNISPQKKLEQNVEIKHVLSNSFGFGGSNSSIIISEYA